jgi:hypothetical protein
VRERARLLLRSLVDGSGEVIAVCAALARLEDEEGGEWLPSIFTATGWWRRNLARTAAVEPGRPLRRTVAPLFGPPNPFLERPADLTLFFPLEQNLDGLEHCFFPLESARAVSNIV